MYLIQDNSDTRIECYMKDRLRSEKICNVSAPFMRAKSQVRQVKSRLLRSLDFVEWFLADAWLKKMFLLLCSWESGCCSGDPCRSEEFSSIVCDILFLEVFKSKTTKCFSLEFSCLHCSDRIESRWKSWSFQPWKIFSFLRVSLPNRIKIILDVCSEIKTCTHVLQHRVVS